MSIQGVVLLELLGQLDVARAANTGHWLGPVCRSLDNKQQPFKLDQTGCLIPPPLNLDC